MNDVVALKRAIAGFERFALLGRETPLEEAPRLSEHLGVRVLVKRDDLGEVGLGGNKLRKLEFLVGDALASGCGALVTFGAVQSNHARQSAAACVRAGLECHLVLTRSVPRDDELYNSNGNLLLDELFGATIWHAGATGDELAAATDRLEDHLAARRVTARWVPPGGSEALGALGYVACALELAGQCSAIGVEPATVVAASATGGTHAGLVCGLSRAMPATAVHGVAVLSPAEETRRTVCGLEAELAQLLGVVPAPQDAISVDPHQLGGGYGIPTESSREATALFARTEGLALDPVYTSKAAASLVAACREGRFGRDDPVVFVHTGGAPGLFAYGRDALPQQQRRFRGS
ncbi:MAG: D-cysteine desulfhydrase family protein [Microthrixaceae bacterium]